MFYFHSFACSCPVFPAPLIKETIVSLSYISPLSVQFSSVQSLSHVWLPATPWTTAASQASLSINNSQSLPKLISIELVMPSNHLNFCHPLLLLASIFPSIRFFPNDICEGCSCLMSGDIQNYFIQEKEQVMNILHFVFSKSSTGLWRPLHILDLAYNSGVLLSCISGVSKCLKKQDRSLSQI